MYTVAEIAEGMSLSLHEMLKSAEDKKVKDKDFRRAAISIIEFALLKYEEHCDKLSSVTQTN